MPRTRRLRHSVRLAVAALAGLGLAAPTPAMAAPACTGQSFPGVVPTTLMATGNIMAGSQLEKLPGSSLPRTSLQPPLVESDEQPTCLAVGACVSQFMLWDDFDGDGFDELLVAYSKFTSLTAPAVLTELIIYDGVPTKVEAAFGGYPPAHNVNSPHLVTSFLGPITGMASGDFDGDGDAEVAVIKAPNTDAAWGAAVFDVPTGTILKSKNTTTAPTAVTFGDLFPTPGQEVIFGVANTLDALAITGTPLAASVMLENGPFGGTVQALAFGEYSGEPASLAVGRSTLSQDFSTDADWKVGTMGFDAASGTLVMRHRYAYDYFANICCNPDQWHEVAQQPTHVAFGDLNHDGKNELVAIIQTQGHTSTKDSEGSVGAYIIGYSNYLPRKQGGSDFDNQFRDELFRLRHGPELITGIDLQDVDGDGNADLAVSAIRPFESRLQTPDGGVDVGAPVGNPQVTSTVVLYNRLSQVLSCWQISNGNVTCTNTPDPVPLAADQGVVPDSNPNHGPDQVIWPMHGSTAVALTTHAVKDTGQPWSPTRCGKCGDGEVEGREECDDFNVDSNDGCSATCAIEFCGDGITQSSEQCDDGNSNANDGCELCGTCPAVATPNLVTFVVDLDTDDANPAAPTATEQGYCVASPGDLDPNAPPCNLRGVLRRAEALWATNPHTQVVALLEHTSHKLKATLELKRGDLTIAALPSATTELPPADVPTVWITIDPTAGTVFSLFKTSQAAACAPTFLRLSNISLKGGDNEGFGFKGGGGVLAENTTLIANNVIFTGNQANQPGAAIYASACDVTITKCLFDSNKNTQQPDSVGNGCTSEGGGIYLLRSHATVDRSAFVNNYAGKGGAITTVASKLTVRNSTMSGNLAAVHGSALVVRGGTVDLHFNTITNNKAVGGDQSTSGKLLGAVTSIPTQQCGDYPTTPADITATGNIIAGNLLNDNPNPDCAMSAETVTHAFLNLVGAGDLECNDKLGDHLTDSLVGTKIHALDPLLGDLKAHAGAAVGVGNLAHDPIIGQNGAPSSPALGQYPAQCAVPPCNDPPELDQRSFIRPAFTSRDLGSIEMNGGDDADADEILSPVDPAPQTASHEFSTIAAGGTTEGTILDYGDVPFYVSLDPATLGVNINMSPGTTHAAAKFAACAQRVRLDMSADQDARLECAAPLVRTPGQTVQLSPPTNFALCSSCLTGTLITPAGASSSYSSGQTITLTEGKTSVEWRSVQQPQTRIYEQSVDACNTMQIRPVAATASSQESSGFSAAKAIDGNASTRWSSAFSDPQWLALDFGRPRHFTEVTIVWENAASANYDLQVSNDGVTWTTVFTDSHADGGTDVITLDATGSRLRMFSRARRTQYGNSIFEIRVKGTALCAEDADALVVYGDTLTRGASTFLLTGDGQQQFTTANFASPTFHLGAQGIEVKTTQNASTGTHWKLMLFANGNSPSTAGIDLHEFNRVEFWAKTNRAGGVTLKGAFGTSEDSGTKTFPAMALTTSWQKFTLDLSGLDLSDVNALLWVYLHKDANAFSFTGVSVFLDDVRLVR